MTYSKKALTIFKCGVVFCASLNAGSGCLLNMTNLMQGKVKPRGAALASALNNPLRLQQPDMIQFLDEEFFQEYFAYMSNVGLEPNMPKMMQMFHRFTDFDDSPHKLAFILVAMQYDLSVLKMLFPFDFASGNPAFDDVRAAFANRVCTALKISHEAKSKQDFEAYLAECPIGPEIRQQILNYMNSPYFLQYNTA